MTGTPEGVGPVVSGDRIIARIEALLDGILVRAREGCEDQVARVGVSRVDRQALTILGDPDDVVVGVDVEPAKHLRQGV